VKNISYLNVLLKMLCRYHLFGYSGFIRSALSFVLLMSLLVTTALAAPSEQSFVVGLLRPDGLIIPFAYFNGTDFTNPWQKPRDYGPTAPNTITDLDVPWFSGLTAPTDSWFVWYPEGGKRLITKKAMKINSHCEEVWGLPTGEVKRKFPEHVYEPTKTGLVTNKKIDVSPFSDISKSGAESQLILKVLRPFFDKGEEEALKKTGIDAYYENELRRSKGVVKSTGLQIMSSQRARLPAKESILFVEVTKKYPKASDSKDRECELISYQKSWLLDAQKSTLLSSEFEVTDCDMTNVSTGKAIGLIRIKDMVYIVHMNIGYESESYSIFRLESGRLKQVLETFGGGC